MTFVSNLGSNPFIIDDSNADQFVQQSRDDGFSTGYEPRPYDTQPEGFFAPVFNSPIIPRSQWDDHIKRQEDEQSSPDHWRIRGGVPVLDQNGYGYCTTEDTEVLTNSGWKLWPELNGTELLGTVNPLTQMLEFQQPLARQVFNYRGEMMYSTNPRVKFGVTPNHRMYVRRWDERARTLSSDYTFTTAENLGWYSGLMAAPRGHLGVEFVELEIEGDRRYDGDDLIALVSLVCSDGYVGSSGKTRDWVSFCCFHEGRRAMVEALAARVGFKEQPGRPGVWTRYSAGALANWMRTECYAGPANAQSKRIPGFVKHASQRQIKLFLQFFGDQNHGKPISHFYSSSKGMVDDLQELLMRIGRRMSITKRPPRESVMKDGHVIRAKESWEAHAYETGELSITRKKQIERDHYNGNVYCATVPNGTLVTRKDDSVLISGNCWMYGTVGAIMTAYAQTGGYVPHLSAMGPAAQGKGWRNQGGYGGEAIRYIERFGIPELSVWPEHKKDKSLPNKPEVKASAEKHKVVDFLELPRSNFNALMSVLLDPINPRPVTMALNWWGHLVYGVKAVKISAGKYGVKIVNSWKPSWGDQGTSVLAESKATAFEQIAIQRVKVRAA